MKITVFILLLFSVSLAYLFCASMKNSAVASSPDAIAVRILPNPENYSPLRWYRKNIKSQGSPQSLIVDGYEAVRDGRTVYVNAANIIDNAPSGSFGNEDNFFTNIYLISYNQAAENDTLDIFSQILAHWNFNTNLDTTGKCVKEGIASKTCMADLDCPADEYCDNKKAEITRDVKRLSDLAEIKIFLDNYKTSHNNHFPDLSSGTYLPQKTISTWPSWQETFGQALKATLPVDPINKLAGCSNPYNPDTCWDENQKRMKEENYNHIFGSSAFPDDRVYVYSVTDSVGSSYKLCSFMESSMINEINGNCRESAIINQAPVIQCGDLGSYTGQPFNANISASDPEGHTLKNWVIVQPTGWTVPINLSDVSGFPNQKKLYSAAAPAKGSYDLKVSVYDQLNKIGTSICPINVKDSCTQTCTTGPGCRDSLDNGETTVGNCCGGACYACKTNYTWDGSTCVPATKTAACTAKPVNTAWNTVSSITQTWNGSAWTPTNTSSQNNSPSTSECRFKCTTGVWNGNSCVIVVVNYSLNLSINGSGTVTCNGSNCQPSYPSGTSLTLTAVPASGSIFTGWSGGLTGNTNPITFPISSDRNVSVTFSPASASTPVLSSNPSSADVGSFPVDGYSVNYPLTIKNIGTAATYALSISGYYDPFSISNTDCTNKILAPGGTCTVTIRFYPTSLGYFVSSLKIDYKNTPDDITDDLSVPLSGTGISAGFVCGSSNVLDNDGNSYPTVQIGTQCWMKENLRTTKKPDGTNLWFPAYCNPAGCGSPWGRLYSWNMAMNYSPAATGVGAKIQGICPAGWHIPSDYNADANDDFQILSNYLGGDNLAGGSLKATSSPWWDSPNFGATDSSGFSAVAAGIYFNNTGSYASRGSLANFISSNKKTSSNGSYRWLNTEFSTFFTGQADKDNVYESVRCIKD